MAKIHVKKGDTVQVIAGKDKGKVGEVLQAIPSESKVIVKGVADKPHRDVRVGDELVIARPGGRKQTVVVRGLADVHIPKAQARDLYEDHTPPPTPDEIEARRLERLFRATQKPPQRLDRRTQRHVAKRKWTT